MSSYFLCIRHILLSSKCTILQLLCVIFFTALTCFSSLSHNLQEANSKTSLKPTVTKYVIININMSWCQQCRTVGFGWNYVCKYNINVEKTVIILFVIQMDKNCNVCIVMIVYKHLFFLDAKGSCLWLVRGGRRTFSSTSSLPFDPTVTQRRKSWP